MIIEKHSSMRFSIREIDVDIVAIKKKSSDLVSEWL